MTMTSIGIIGAGNIGEAFARALVPNGIAATISNSRGPDSLADLVRETRRPRRTSSSSPSTGPSCPRR
jgi:predicted dinucleotide-binding enzyme